jgi:hypothetical protein
VWTYPNQLGAWSVVHIGKWSSWSLLVIMTFSIVANLRHIKDTIHIPTGSEPFSFVRAPLQGPEGKHEVDSVLTKEKGSDPNPVSPPALDESRHTCGNTTLTPISDTNFTSGRQQQ